VDATYRYTAFGGKAEAAVNTSTFAARNRYRFSTKYLDAEVETTEGTYYYGYRHYATALGRWTTRDPLRESGGVNLNGMAGNSLLSMMDYLGLAGEKCDLGSKAKIVGGTETLKDQGGSAVTPEEQEKAMKVAKAAEAVGAKGLGKAGGSVKGTTDLADKAADAIRDKQKKDQGALANMMGGQQRYWTVELKFECCKCTSGQKTGVWTAMDPKSGDSSSFTDASETSAKKKEAHQTALTNATCP
jgi:RHS repeat-associated protein